MNGPINVSLAPVFYSSVLLSSGKVGLADNAELMP